MFNIHKNQLVIIADDLTGALDASGYLAGRGISVRVFPVPPFEFGAGVTVINTDSRNDTSTAAAKILHDLSKHLAGKEIFKKIDSTLRGNVAVEIVAMLDVLSLDKAVICPAFPAMGRTIENGVLKVNGISVSETDFGRDALNPVDESFIPALFEREGFHAGLVSLADIAEGHEHLVKVFAARTEKVLVCDATDETHLRNIALAAATFRGDILLAGSGGLAREIDVPPEKFSTNRNIPESRTAGPALVIVGSRHLASAAQLINARSASGLTLLQLDANTLESADAKSQEMERLVYEAGVLLEKRKSVAITSAFSPLTPGRAKEVAAELAGVAGMLVKAYPIAGLFLSGGDTAMAVCRELGIKSIRVYGEIQPGIPAGEIEVEKRSIRLVTKAGGFGGETAIVESMQYLERGTL